MKKQTIVLSTGIAVLMMMLCLSSDAWAVRGARPTKLAVGAIGSLMPDPTAAVAAMLPIGADGRLIVQPEVGFNLTVREGLNKQGTLDLGSAITYDFIEGTNLSIYALGKCALLTTFAKSNSYGMYFMGGMGARFRFTDIPDLYFMTDLGLGLQAYFNNGSGVGVTLGGTVPFRAGIMFQL